MIFRQKAYSQWQCLPRYGKIKMIKTGNDKADNLLVKLTGEA